MGMGHSIGGQSKSKTFEGLDFEELDDKYCSRCRRFKPLTEFYPNASRSNGLSSYCKPCDNAYRREKFEQKR